MAATAALMASGMIIAAARPPRLGGMAEDPAASGPTDDWTVQVADRVESVVQAVRTRTTVPIVKLAKILVFGIILAGVGLGLAVLLVIAVIRLADSYWWFHPYARRVWVTYAVLGAIFVLAGAFSMRKRTARTS
jgi:hypothetical protein